MPSPRRPRRKDDRARKRAEWKAQHGETPYAEWPTASDSMRARVEQATKHKPLPIWSKGKSDRQRQLTVDDLAIGLWAVVCVGSYNRKSWMAGD